MKRLELILGIIFQVGFLVGVISALQIIVMLRAVWFTPGDVLWNGFLLEHLNMWAVKFCLLFMVSLELPALLCFWRGLKHRTPSNKQIWKRNGGWGEWR